MKSVFVRTIAFLVAVVFSVSAQAQNNEEKAPQLTVIRAAKMIDVRAGEVIENAAIVIEGGKIKSAGADLDVPSGARLIDLGDATLLPGLIDAHTHLLHQYYRDRGGDDANRILEIVEMGAARRGLLGAKHAREMLEAGFTSVRDLGNSGVNGDVALRDAIDAGWVTGPRMFVSTRALSPVGGQFQSLTPEAQGLVAQEYVEVSGIEEARRAVRQAIYDGADCIKVVVNTGPRVLPLEELKVIVEEAHRAGLRVAAHATQGDAAALIAAEAGVDSIEHGYTVSDKVLSLMAKKDIFLVPTDSPTAERHHERIRRAMKHRVRIAIGSDLYYQEPGKTRGEAAAGIYKIYVGAGMPAMEVLRSATLHPAALIDPKQSIGAIEPGRMADIIAVQGDVLQDITVLENVAFVMKGGDVVKDEIGAH